MQSKGPTPSRAKRVTFDVWARSVCVHIITLMTFRLIVPSSCVFVKYLQDFCLFFLRNARVVDVFLCAAVSRCARCDVSVWHTLGRPKSLPFTPPDGVLARLSASRKERWKEYRFAFFCSLSALTGFLNVCFDVGTVFVESFSNCLSLFRFLTSSYNTILAYFLTVGALFISIISTFNKLVNWKLAPL